MALKHAEGTRALSQTRLDSDRTVTCQEVISSGYLASYLFLSLVNKDYRPTAEKLVETAHQICPYSNATRVNVDVGLTVV
jgi:organic hydroperoxide reductase OsmC/OhrA